MVYRTTGILTSQKFLSLGLEFLFISKQGSFQPRRACSWAIFFHFRYFLKFTLRYTSNSVSGTTWLASLKIVTLKKNQMNISASDLWTFFPISSLLHLCCMQFSSSDKRLQEIFFQNHPLPHPPQELNGRPLNQIWLTL